MSAKKDQKSAAKATYLSDSKLLLVPASQSTIGSLVGEVHAHATRKRMTANGIGTVAGVGPHPVARFFEGSPKTPKRGKKVVPGCVRFDTALRIIQAVGLDLQIVVREAPVVGRS